MFHTRIDALQPSQLYISAAKLARVQRDFVLRGARTLPPVPVAWLSGRHVLMDGHTRVFAAWLAGETEIRAYIDPDDLDWAAYEVCVSWCAEAWVHSIPDLAGRVVDARAYEDLWIARCRRMHAALRASTAGCPGVCPV